MQLCAGRRDISRETVLTDALWFGFTSYEAAGDGLDDLLSRIETGFARVASGLDAPVLALMQARLQSNLLLQRG